MLKFISRRSGPPGGMYFYETPDTKVLFRHPTMSAVVRAVQQHYLENNMPIPGDLESRIEDQMCLYMPESFCRGDADGRARKRVVTLDSLRKATLELAAGNPRINPGEAERRARVCANCGHNNREACTSCTGMTEWARKLAGSTLSGLDSALGICEVDCTALSAKVHMSNVPEDDAYPDNCWRSK